MVRVMQYNLREAGAARLVGGGGSGSDLVELLDGIGHLPGHLLRLGVVIPERRGRASGGQACLDKRKNAAEARGRS